MLDLRNNPGGVLNAAVAVSDAFLNKGLIVYTEGRVADSRLKFPRRRAISSTAPRSVLVNGGSASARRSWPARCRTTSAPSSWAPKTFGKGSVQTLIVPVSNGAALKLTTARYYTPYGRSIQGTAFVPDIASRRSQDHQERGSRRTATRMPIWRATSRGGGASGAEGRKKDDRAKYSAGCWPRPTITGS